MLLLDPAVDVAVIELSPADVLQNGLDFDGCDASAVIDGDASGEPGVAEAIRVVLDATRRSVVLAAGDDRCRALESSKDPRLRRIDANESGETDRSTLYAAALADCLRTNPVGR
jgi:hypothetical protein